MLSWRMRTWLEGVVGLNGSERRYKDRLEDQLQRATEWFEERSSIGCRGL
jgi:hypothetical protein